MNYCVVMCPVCGAIQSSQAMKVFKCKLCDYARQIHKVRILYASNDPNEVRVVCAKLKERERK